MLWNFVNFGLLKILVDKLFYELLENDKFMNLHESFGVFLGILNEIYHFWSLSFLFESLAFIFFADS